MEPGQIASSVTDTLAQDLLLVAPLDGWATPLAEVADAVFSGKMMGDGVAVDPLSGTLASPCDGEVLVLHAARHALTLRAASGAEILLHIGLDTVALAGDGFTAHVRQGERSLPGREHPVRNCRSHPPARSPQANAPVRPSSKTKAPIQPSRPTTRAARFR